MGIETRTTNRRPLIRAELLSHDIRAIPSGKSIDELLQASVKIEHPEVIKRARSGASISRSERRALEREEKSLDKAYSYLFGLREGEYLNKGALIDTNEHITGIRGFRTSTLYLDGSKVACPNSVKIPEHLDKLFSRVNKNGQICPVERAAYLHTGIAWIHPFFDGNGRTARLYEGRLLHSYGLPIPRHILADRDIYMPLVSLAAAGYAEDNIGRISPYAWHLATLINRGLERMINNAGIKRSKRLFGVFKLSGK